MRTPTLSLLAALVLAGCASNAPNPEAAATPDPHGEPAPACEPRTGSAPPSGTRAGYAEVVVSVAEPDDADPCFGLLAPSSAYAGWTAFTFRNDGAQPHVLAIYGLEEGPTLDDLLAALAEGGAEPSWARPVGGVGFLTPGRAGTSLLDLAPGRYALVCFVDGHHTRGMIRELEVVASERPPPPAPVADVVVELADFAFHLPPTVEAGPRVVEFRNAGKEPHEAPLVRLEGEATLDAFLEAIAGGNGPPPGAAIGGAVWIPPGGSALALVDFEPGRYATVCFVESAEHEGAPHLALGMRAEWTVRAPGA